MLNGLAARREIPETRRAQAHRVREYRNSFVHERDEEQEKLEIAVARAYLCTFFSFLPPRW